MTKIVTLRIEIPDDTIEDYGGDSWFCYHCADTYNSVKEMIENQMNRVLQIITVKVLNVEDPFVLSYENAKSLYCGG